MEKNFEKCGFLAKTGTHSFKTKKKWKKKVKTLT
jgi:hypothetical protein